MRGFLKSIGGGRMVSRAQQGKAQGPFEEWDLGMQFGRGVEDLDRLFLEPRPSQKRRFHQESPQVAGVRREIGFTRADGPLVVSTCREGLRAVELPGGIP